MKQNIIYAIALLGAIAILLVLLPVFGVALPTYTWHIFGIVVAVCIGILAVKFIFAQANSP